MTSATAKVLREVATGICVLSAVACASPDRTDFCRASDGADLNGWWVSDPYGRPENVMYIDDNRYAIETITADIATDSLSAIAQATPGRENRFWVMLVFMGANATDPRKYNTDPPPMLYDPRLAILTINGRQIPTLGPWFKFGYQESRTNSMVGELTTFPVNVNGNNVASRVGAVAYLYISFETPHPKVGDQYSLQLGNVVIHGTEYKLPVRRGCRFAPDREIH